MTDGFEPRTPIESYHPGPPRYVTVGDPIRDPVFVLRADTTGLDVEVEVDPHDHGRDNLAPRLPTLREEPDTYDADAFEWSVAESPADSDGDVLSFATSTTAVPRYDYGRDNVAEFEADVPGRYVLELDAPDGTHEQTIYAFPEPGEGGPPRIDLDAAFADGGFHVDANAALAPDSDANHEDLSVTFLADDRDALDTEAIEVGEDGVTATVPVDGLDGERARIHAAAHDGNSASVQDVIELRPDGTVERPNRPPAWLDDAVIYEIFPRSWAGERGATTFETLIDGDETTGARGLDYLDELGVDVLWLTPVVPAMSAGVGKVPGGPHGYGTLDYFGIAEDLVPEGYDDPVDAYREFVAACNERGIKVLFDLVINHAGRGIDIFQDTIAEQGDPPGTGLVPLPTVEAWDEDARTFDWWDRVDVPRYDSEGNVIEAAPRPTGFGDGRWMPNFDYGTVALREYLLGVADFWAREVGVDGFRCDVAHGVPHSFWMEVRELVRAADSEFLMLDETLPNDPAYSQHQFDAHFDTHGFTYAAKDAAQIDADERGDPAALLDAIEARREQGHPDYTRLLNAVENHDEHRLLNQAAIDVADPDREALTDAEWEHAAARQRACFAASVTLPGVPMVYYGAERAISRYGDGRHDGSEDDRGIRDGEIEPRHDVRPGGRQRAFMNWEQYDADHLSFYRELIDRYRDLDALKPGAELERLSLEASDDTIAFVRDATDLADVSGPERLLVIVNFENDPIAVSLPDGVEASSLVAEADAAVAVNSEGPGEETGTPVDTVGAFAVPGDAEIQGVSVER